MFVVGCQFKKRHDQRVWVEPMSATAFTSPEDQAKERAAEVVH
jgi:hypothetical protein